MALAICAMYHRLLDKLVAASANYHLATSNLQACAGQGERVQFAFEMHNCKLWAENCRQAAEALREHTSIHGCNNQDGAKRPMNDDKKK